ncbi:MAG: 6-carboxyhexanoate--CoA ligase [Tissierellia bacterium]|nr:6-carboxyhexanoate--CoA ligase [Tissierellia bacterium]
MKYSVKMRASKKIKDRQIHISGAERIVNEDHLFETVEFLQRRGMNHEKGSSDLIHIKIERIEEKDLLRLKALEVETLEVDTVQEGLENMKNILETFGLNSDYILNLFSREHHMRGAILLDVQNYQRLEEDFSRGIRVSYMDYEVFSKATLVKKDHFREALALATKTVYGPGVMGELCISDDPHYQTGYIATRQKYLRITKLKEWGSEKGIRIILFDSCKASKEACIDYLKNKKVLIIE